MSTIFKQQKNNGKRNVLIQTHAIPVFTACEKRKKKKKNHKKTTLRTVISTSEMGLRKVTGPEDEEALFLASCELDDDGAVAIGALEARTP